MATVAKSDKTASKSSKTVSESSETVSESSETVSMKSAKEFLMTKLNKTVKENDVSLFRVEEASPSQAIFVRPDMNGGFETNRLSSQRFRSWLHINSCGGMETKMGAVNNTISCIEDWAIFDTSLQPRKFSCA